jgi:hypothetical protein
VMYNMSKSRRGLSETQWSALKSFAPFALGLLSTFGTLRRVVKGHCSCRPWRKRIHTKPEKVKCKCTTEKMGTALDDTLLRRGESLLHFALCSP